MPQYWFEVADERDDADLRRVLSHMPRDGRVAVVFRREPSFFSAAEVDGRFLQVIAAREQESGRIVGFGCRAISDRFLNGGAEPVGYLNSLRALDEYLTPAFVGRGFRHLRRLHEKDQRTRLYLNTITEGNKLAIRLLTSGRGGLPAYKFMGRYYTVAIDTDATPRGFKYEPPADLEIRFAREEDIEDVCEFLHREGSQRQFFPAYDLDDLLDVRGLLKNMVVADVLLAIRGGRIVGTLAGWDQREFKQTVVHGYGRAISRVRLLLNILGRFAGGMRLPKPGSELYFLTAALQCVADDDREVFQWLLVALQARARELGFDKVLVGMHQRDPLLDVLRNIPATAYTERLYAAAWEDGADMLNTLDDRVPYLELGAM